MDGRRFDELSRALGRRRTRRGVVAGAVGGLAGLALGLAGRGRGLGPPAEVAAGSRPLTCPANVTVSNDPNQCGAVVNYPPPTAVGFCGTVSCSPPSGSFFPVGTTTVDCASTVKVSCSFSITVNDTEPPSVTCPADVTAGNDPDQCGAVLTYLPPTATDNCPGVTVACAPPAGSFFPVGATTTTCTATDAVGNTASCAFAATVNDTQPPTITCPGDQTVVASEGEDGAVVAYPPSTPADNCPGVAASCDPPSGSLFPVGTTAVICTATDGAGGTGTCAFALTVQTAPTPAPTGTPAPTAAATASPTVEATAAATEPPAATATATATPSPTAAGPTTQLPDTGGGGDVGGRGPDAGTLGPLAALGAGAAALAAWRRQAGRAARDERG